MKIKYNVSVNYIFQHLPRTQPHQTEYQIPRPAPDQTIPELSPPETPHSDKTETSLETTLEATKLEEL